MTGLAQIVKAAQEALAAEQQHPRDLVAECRAYYGDTAWLEADRWHATGELPQTVQGLELTELDLQLEATT